MEAMEAKIKGRELGLKKSLDTRKYKALITHIKKQSKKEDIYFNNMVEMLIDTGYYKHIYTIFINNDDIDGLLTPEDIEILHDLDFIEPEQLETKLRTFAIYEQRI
jgi:hypothetical protein